MACRLLDRSGRDQAWGVPALGSTRQMWRTRGLDDLPARHKTGLPSKWRPKQVRVVATVGGTRQVDVCSTLAVISGLGYYLRETMQACRSPAAPNTLGAYKQWAAPDRLDVDATLAPLPRLGVYLPIATLDRRVAQLLPETRLASTNRFGTRQA